jgi:hypothetical protein
MILSVVGVEASRVVAASTTRDMAQFRTVEIDYIIEYFFCIKKRRMKVCEDQLKAPSTMPFLHVTALEKTRSDSSVPRLDLQLHLQPSTSLNFTSPDASVTVATIDYCSDKKQYV